MGVKPLDPFYGESTAANLFAVTYEFARAILPRGTIFGARPRSSPVYPPDWALHPLTMNTGNPLTLISDCSLPGSSLKRSSLFS